jgi:hypothetical protein
MRGNYWDGVFRVPNLISSFGDMEVARSIHQFGVIKMDYAGEAELRQPQGRWRSYAGVTIRESRGEPRVEW